MFSSTDSPILPEICSILDFRRPSQLPGSRRFGIFNNRRLFDFQLGVSLGEGRRLQFTGDRCDDDVLDYIRQDPDLSTFEDLLDTAGLQDIFLCAGPFTVLAPTNEAFAAMDPALLAQLRQPANQELLQEVLLYHLLPEYQPSRSFVAGPAETMLFDDNIDVQLAPLRFDGAGVINPDNIACNGVVHTIDDVLVPGQDNCSDLTFVNRRRLQDTDCDTDILETARGIDELSTVVSLIDSAGLDYIFDCPGPFTALLPNNDAFENLSEADLNFLLDPSNVAALEELLLYHILPNRTMTADFMPGPTATLSDSDVEVRLFPLRFDDASVVTPDIDACEGLIDIIDTVLSPFLFPTPTPTSSPTAAPTPEDICDLFTFNRRIRMLQDGGEGCTTNVFDTAQANPDLEIITELISFAGLEPIFDCAGPFTALLPTNAAMEALENDRPEFLQTLATDPGELRDFLLYHILPGAQLTTDFSAGPSDTLLDGNQVEVTLDPLEFDGFGVQTGDIQACNGFIHIIGGILECTSVLCNWESFSHTIIPQRTQPQRQQPRLRPKHQ